MRLLFCCQSTPGLLLPVLGLARTMKARGHAVCVLTEPDAAELVRNRGLTYLAPTPGRACGLKMADWGLPDAIHAQCAYVLAAARRWRPDTLVGQVFTLGAYAISAAAGLPLAILGGPTFLFPTSESARAAWNSSTSEARAALTEQQWRHDVFIGLLNLALSFAKAPPVAAVADTPMQGDLFLLRTIPELEPRQPDHSRVRHVGPCLEPWPEAHAGFASWLAQPSPRRGLLYVQAGRTFNQPSFLPALLAASERLPFRLVADVLRSDESCQKWPEHALACPGISMDMVLPHASCAITSGHGSAALGAASHGVPSLLLPCGSGSEDLARQFVRCGIALSLPNQLASADKLVELISHLHEDGALHQRARDISAAIQRFQGDAPYARAADALEDGEWRSHAGWWRTEKHPSQPRRSAAGAGLDRRIAAIARV